MNSNKIRREKFTYREYNCTKLFYHIGVSQMFQMFQMFGMILQETISFNIEDYH